MFQKNNNSLGFMNYRLSLRIFMDNIVGTKSAKQLNSLTRMHKRGKKSSRKAISRDAFLNQLFINKINAF